jgi:hypothetical protein
MGLIREVFKMLSFWRRHRYCEGFKETKAFGMYMLWCQAHMVGETTGDDTHLMADCPIAAELAANPRCCHCARSGMPMGQP